MRVVATIVDSVAGLCIDHMVTTVTMTMLLYYNTSAVPAAHAKHAHASCCTLPWPTPPTEVRYESQP